MDLRSKEFVDHFLKMLILDILFTENLEFGEANAYPHFPVPPPLNTIKDTILHGDVLSY